MSTCSCGVGGNNIPKPLEEKKYASVNEAYDTIKSKINKKKYTNFAFFLVLVIIFILCSLIKDYKC